MTMFTDDYHEVRDEEVLDMFIELRDDKDSLDSVLHSLAECGATNYPETYPELLKALKTELKKRGI